MVDGDVCVGFSKATGRNLRDFQRSKFKIIKENKNVLINFPLLTVASVAWRYLKFYVKTLAWDQLSILLREKGGRGGKRNMQSFTKRESMCTTKMIFGKEGG